MNKVCVANGLNKINRCDKVKLNTKNCVAQGEKEETERTMDGKAQVYFTGTAP